MWLLVGEMLTRIMDIPQSETKTTAIHTTTLNDCMTKILLYKSNMDIFTVVKTIWTRQEATTRHCPSNVSEWPTCREQFGVAAGRRRETLTTAE